MKKTVTRPKQAASKTTVNEAQRELYGLAVGLSLQATELAATARRVMEIWQLLQNAQGR